MFQGRELRRRYGNLVRAGLQLPARESGWLLAVSHISISGTAVPNGRHALLERSWSVLVTVPRPKPNSLAIALYEAHAAEAVVSRRGQRSAVGGVARGSGPNGCTRPCTLAQRHSPAGSGGAPLVSSPGLAPSRTPPPRPIRESGTGTRDSWCQCPGPR